LFSATKEILSAANPRRRTGINSQPLGSDEKEQQEVLLLRITARLLLPQIENNNNNTAHTTFL